MFYTFIQMTFMRFSSPHSSILSAWPQSRGSLKVKAHSATVPKRPQSVSGWWTVNRVELAPGKDKCKSDCSWIKAQWERKQLKSRFLQSHSQLDVLSSLKTDKHTQRQTDTQTGQDLCCTSASTFNHRSPLWAGEEEDKEAIEHSNWSTQSQLFPLSHN